MRRKLSILTALPVLALGACASSQTETVAAPPASVAYASGQPESVPSTVASTMATAPTLADGSSSGSAMGSDADTAAGSAMASGGGISVDMLSQMLATEQGRQLVVQGLASQTGLSVDAATCFVGHMDPAALTAMANLGAAQSGAAATGQPSAQSAGQPPVAVEAMMALESAVTACGISPEALMGAQASAAMPAPAAKP